MKTAIPNTTLPNDTETCRIIQKENSTTAIPLILDLPKSWLFDKPIRDIDKLMKLVNDKLPAITELATDACLAKYSETWQTLQKILYHWNRQDLLRKNVTQDYRFIVQSILRNKIVEIEQNMLPKHLLECAFHFTPELATQELADKAKSHRINFHPLLNELNDHGLPIDALRTFINNYYVNNRVFHLFIAALALSTPFERRTELANNFYDELGSGDNSMAHPALFFKNFATLGVPDYIIPQAEALYLVNSKLFATFLSGDYHFGMGGLGFIELTMPNQMTKILNGLKKSGLAESDLEFWELHIAIDEKHGKAWFNEMQQLITNVNEAITCLQGGLFLLEARATLYDGIWNSINQTD